MKILFDVGMLFRVLVKSRHIKRKTVYVIQHSTQFSYYDDRMLYATPCVVYNNGARESSIIKATLNIFY